MKCVYLFITILILCSCFATKKVTPPPAGQDEDALSAIQETARETITNASSNARQYSFELISDVYFDMNDLTYFLADTSIKSLRLHGGTFTDLSPLAELTELEELKISGNRYIADISPIGSLVNLEKLYLSNYTKKEGLEALSSLVNLRYLDIFHKDKYYRELLPLQKLEVLTLGNEFPAELDATYIAQLHSLKELEISPGVKGTDSIENIELLKNLVNLEKLEISGVIDLDISWITHLQKLKHLVFWGCTINDVSPLAELPNLISLDFYLSRVNDITPLLESTSIKSIDRIIIEDHYPDGITRMFKERGIEFTPHYSDR